MTIARVDAAALRSVGASSVLAVDPSVIGGTVRLAEAEPDAEPSSVGPDVVGVRIQGPLAQRAVSGLCGYVDGYDAIAARFDIALEASEGGVVVILDSPGGDVAGLEAAVERMRAAKERSGKRVVVYVDELAASAAYWIASAIGDEIVAPVAARIGSIGCIGAMVDESEAERMAGREWIVRREPEGKAAGMSVAPMREIASEQLGREVKACAERFYEAVAMARPKMSAADARALNGAVLGARAAKRAGLIDRVGTMETALASASKKAPKRQEKRQMKNLLGALGLGPDAQDDEIESVGLKALDAFKVQLEAEKAATEAAKVAAAELANELADARKVLADIAAKSDADKRAAIVDEAVKAGKLAPAKRDEIAAKGEQHGTEWLATLVDAMPVIAPSKAPVAAAAPAASGDLTQRELAMCVEMGIDPKVYSAKKAATKGKD